MSTEERTEQLTDLLRDFDTAMLTTHAADDGLRARPMRIVDVRSDGTLVLVTHIQAEKVDELVDDPRCCVTLQDDARYVSLTATARIDRDRERIARLHESSWNLWFPGGKEDPNIALLDVEPSRGEYWDGSGWNRIKFAIAAVRAAVQGETLDRGVTDHAKVSLS